mgnify:CR=1 FL=1
MNRELVADLHIDATLQLLDALEELGRNRLQVRQVKRDARDGRPKLIEVNPRITVTGDCASYMGVEVAWLHYLDMIGRPVSPVTASRFSPWSPASMNTKMSRRPTYGRGGATSHVSGSSWNSSFTTIHMPTLCVRIRRSRRS